MVNGQLYGVSVLLSDKQFAVLSAVSSGGYILAVSKICDVSYSHVYKVIHNFEKIGLIEKTKLSGRIRILKLSAKGKKVLDLYLKIMEELNGGVA